MGHIGIIAEYNPFHNGHQFQIDQIKKQFPDKKIVVIMSGNFVQRGEAAIYNKYIRCECALSAGADLVFELPPLFATASAEHFASAAVLALAFTGVVDTICFGAECDQLKAFEQIADILVNEPDAYQLLLKKYLKMGHSFPKARNLALADYLDDCTCVDFLKSPNNILGVEYIKAIKRYHLPLTPYIIKRNGADYHDKSIAQHNSSATAIRQALSNNQDISTVSHTMPSSCMQIILDAPFSHPIDSHHLYSYTKYALWMQKGQYNHFLDVSTDIANQLNHCSFPETWDELLNSLSNKNYTTSRFRHVLLNLLLGITKKEMEFAKNSKYISYLRILGFRKNASSILKTMKQTANVPIITKVADANQILSPDAYQAFKRDLSISELYNQIYQDLYHEKPKNEFQHSVIIRNL